MKVLVANLGSTSLKWRLFDFANGQERMLHKGGFERVSDYPKAIGDCLAELKQSGAIQSESELSAVGFKTIMARGLDGCVRLDERVLAAMEVCNDIAPAHNPPYLTGIRLFAQRMPGTPLIALFETAFYQFAPPAAMRYAVPESWYELGVRRYGYHGASHKYIAERSAQLLGRDDIARRVQNLYLDGGVTPVDQPDLRVISCHLGGSSSITGIHNGVAIGNSLGMSPQSGLPHNNRVGDLDSFALPFVMRSTGASLDEVQHLLCKESGWKGLSGGLNDVRDINAEIAKGNDKARLAKEVFIHEARRWIGSYFFLLDGAEAIVFTAGIGENQADVREAICANLNQLGLVLDPDKNRQTRAQEAVISAAHSRVQVLVIPTNEELVVAREAKRLLEARQS